MHQQQSLSREPDKAYIFDYGIDLTNKTLLLAGPIGPELLLRTTAAVDQLKLSDTDCLTVLLSTEGGSIYDGLGIYDLLKWVQSEKKCKVKIIGIGYVMSMGAVILQAASQGLREILPHTTVMVHLGHETTPAEIHPKERERLVSEFDRVGKIAFTIIADAMGMSYHKWKKSHEYDTYFDAESAVRLGLADRILKETNSGKQTKRKAR